MANLPISQLPEITTGLTSNAEFAVAQGAMALFGKENKELEKSILKVQAAMTLLQGVQELANLATGEGIVKTYALAASERVAAVASKALGVEISAATAMATGGLSDWDDCGRIHNRSIYICCCAFNL